MALSVPLLRFTSQVGGGSAFFVRHHSRYEQKDHFIYSDCLHHSWRDWLAYLFQFS